MSETSDFSPEQQTAVYYVYSQYLNIEKLATAVATLRRNEPEVSDRAARLSRESSLAAQGVAELAYLGDFSLTRQWAKRRIDPEGWEQIAREVLRLKVQNQDESSTDTSEVIDIDKEQATTEMSTRGYEEELSVGPFVNGKIDPETGLPVGFIKRIEELEAQLKRRPVGGDLERAIAVGWGPERPIKKKR